MRAHGYSGVFAGLDFNGALGGKGGGKGCLESSSSVAVIISPTKWFWRQELLPHSRMTKMNEPSGLQTWIGVEPERYTKYS